MATESVRNLADALRKHTEAVEANNVGKRREHFSVVYDTDGERSAKQEFRIARMALEKTVEQTDETLEETR